MADATARKWYQEGLRTVDDVRARRDLTEMQHVGVKYCSDFQQRVPRQEVADAEQLIQEATVEVGDCAWRCSNLLAFQRRRLGAVRPAAAGLASTSSRAALVAASFVRRRRP